MFWPGEFHGLYIHGIAKNQTQFRDFHFTSGSCLGFPGGSDDKESACSVGDLALVTGFDPWVGIIPWRRPRQPTPVFLPGESPWTEEPGGLQSTGSQTVEHDSINSTGSRLHLCLSVPKHLPWSGEQYLYVQFQAKSGLSKLCRINRDWSTHITFPFVEWDAHKQHSARHWLPNYTVTPSVNQRNICDPTCHYHSSLCQFPWSFSEEVLLT